MTTDGLPLWATSKPPARSCLPAYRKWRLTEEGRKVLDVVCAEAMRLYHEGATRISINAVSEIARQQLRISFTNSFRPHMADEVVAIYPVLDQVIVRHRRKVRPGL